MGLHESSVSDSDLGSNVRTQWDYYTPRRPDAHLSDDDIQVRVKAQSKPPEVTPTAQPVETERQRTAQGVVSWPLALLRKMGRTIEFSGAADVGLEPGSRPRRTEVVATTHESEMFPNSEFTQLTAEDIARNAVESQEFLDMPATQYPNDRA